MDQEQMSESKEEEAMNRHYEVHVCYLVVLPSREEERERERKWSSYGMKLSPGYIQNRF